MLDESLGHALCVQGRVIYALMMREMHAACGRAMLGYFWIFAQTAFGVTIMWLFRHFMRLAPPHGLSVLSFLALGCALFNIVRGCAVKSLGCTGANKALLTFPQVTPLDAYLARCAVVACTETLACMAILFIGWLAGIEVHLSDAGGLLFCFFAATTLGTGLGMILSALALRLPFITRIVPVCFRLLFFVSGVIFSVTPFTGRIGHWILWNPILQIIEHARTCISWGYPSDFTSLAYIAAVSLSALVLGLLLERGARREEQ